MTGQPTLDVRNLRVEFPGRHGTVTALDDVSLSIRPGEILGVVGESGAGKSMTGRAILKLLPGGATSAVKSMKLGDTDLAELSENEMLGIRGKRISMILQDPKYSLNPVMRVGHQIAEAFRVHHRASKAEAEERALEMLAAVRIREPRRVFSLYPHEVSGGMGQRIMIAMMLIPEPELIIADEPTSALDVTVRLQVLAILDDLVSTRGIGLMFISHDLNLVSSFCDEVLIMYAGRIVERCPAAELHRAKHPYTRGLLASLPRLEDGHKRLRVLERDPSWRDEPIPAEA